MSAKSIIPVQTTLSEKKYQPPKKVLSEHKEFMGRIGLKLKSLREENGLSSSALAKKVGISRNNYHQMEEGNIYFNFLSLLKIISYYKEITPEDFFKHLS